MHEWCRSSERQGVGNGLIEQCRRSQANCLGEGCAGKPCSVAVLLAVVLHRSDVNTGIRIAWECVPCTCGWQLMSNSVTSLTTCQLAPQGCTVCHGPGIPLSCLQAKSAAISAAVTIWSCMCEHVVVNGRHDACVMRVTNTSKISLMVAPCVLL
jgi:hypothetical protein